MRRHDVQRWSQKRDLYRPRGEPIRTAEYDVELIKSDNTAKRFVLEHHYSGSYPAARFRMGLYHRGGLVGVAVFSHPCNDRVLSNTFSEARAVELGRFVLLDEVPANGETWFLGRSFELLRQSGIDGVLSFSDPVPRQTQDGRLVFPGHIGTIYQAHNACYLGRGKARTLRLLPDGSVLSDRAISKIRRQERGAAYSARLLEEHGAIPLSGGEDPSVWLNRWLDCLTARLRHPGNHKYAWRLRRSAARKRLVASGRPYPKAA